VVVVGGTRFIGRRVVEDLVGRGDDVVVVHRGETEPAGLVTCRHLHATRAEFSSVAAEVRRFAPDAIIDTLAMTRADIDDVLAHLPDTQIVLLSCVYIYEAFWLVHNDQVGEPVPLD
jgi:nucleoside-diphosphate-sugar epimerase